MKKVDDNIFWQIVGMREPKKQIFFGRRTKLIIQAGEVSCGRKSVIPMKKVSEAYNCDSSQ
ncbi:hypothetical protein [Paenibacillus sp. FSL R7-0333]|uniref:hypothetical protein n=1 Tax=Paenibacillus sp. FSL M7-0896 TaxID=2921610 RepID=UPI00096D7B83|nr:hypothetical protein BK146_29845 [Paenibacillus sp. FSL R7-0333]